MICTFYHESRRKSVASRPRRDSSNEGMRHPCRHLAALSREPPLRATSHARSSSALLFRERMGRPFVPFARGIPVRARRCRGVARFSRDAEGGDDVTDRVTPGRILGVISTNLEIDAACISFDAGGGDVCRLLSYSNQR